MTNQDSNLDLSLLKELRKPKTNNLLLRRAKNITGQQFGHIVPYGFVGNGERGATWLCRCDCGRFALLLAPYIQRLSHHTCGLDRLPWERCYRRPAHKQTHTRGYHIWATMIQRCHNPLNPSYEKYGATGIRVCDRWHSFTNFIEDMGQPPLGMSIDRFPIMDGNYEPSNCRWATATQQARNTKRNKWITINGETMCHSEASERFGITREKIRMRLALNWTPEEAVGLVFKERWKNPRKKQRRPPLHP